MKNFVKEIGCIEGYRENWINFDKRYICINEVKDNKSQKKKFKKKNEKKTKKRRGMKNVAHRFFSFPTRSFFLL